MMNTSCRLKVLVRHPGVARVTVVSPCELKLARELTVLVIRY